MERTDFNSLSEFCNVTFKHPVNLSIVHKALQRKDGTWVSQTSNPRSWLGADTTQEAADRVLHGWLDGARKVFVNLADMEVPEPVSVKRKLTRADQGDELDIHSIYRGDLEHAWTSRRRKHTRAKLTVRIVAQTNLLAAMYHEELFWRGAAVVKLSDMLTAAGYNVEIIGALASDKVDGKKFDFLCTFPLKAASQPLDCEQLAGVLCNAGFHRLYGFRAYCALAGHVVKAAFDGSGCTSETEGRIIREAAFDSDGTKTFSTPYQIGNKEAAQDWVKSCLDQLSGTDH